MELRQLRYFAAVAKRGHFTRAADDLQIAQPGLSQQIAALERDLGVRLFERTSRRVRVTDAGAALLERSEKILADVEAARDEMRRHAGDVRGRVVLGSLQMLAEVRLPKLLRRFHARHPLVEIALREDVTDAILAGLRERELDLAIVHVDASLGRPRGVVTETLFDDELALAVAPDHRLAQRRAARVDDLRDVPFIAFKPGTGMRRAVEGAAAARGFAPDVAFESGDSLTIRGLVAEGLGVTVLPLAMADVPGPSVRFVPFARPGLTRRISLAWSERHALRPVARRLAAFLREHLQT